MTTDATLVFALFLSMLLVDARASGQQPDVLPVDMKTEAWIPPGKTIEADAIVLPAMASAGHAVGAPRGPGRVGNEDVTSRLPSDRLLYDDRSDVIWAL